MTLRKLPMEIRMVEVGKAPQWCRAIYEGIMQYVGGL